MKRDDDFDIRVSLAIKDGMPLNDAREYVKTSVAESLFGIRYLTPYVSKSKSIYYIIGIFVFVLFFKLVEYIQAIKAQ